jgi:biopolymer transport protein ExbD
MPKVKIPRKSISLDMTAICDMAFLLLSFFMLTTTFKEKEAVAVDIPSSISEIKLPEKDMMIISIEKSGAIFLGLDGQKTKIDLLNNIGRKSNIAFSDRDKLEFSLMSSFGTSVAALKPLLKIDSDQRSSVKQSGIPADSINNELRDWIYFARISNPNLRVGIKGDKLSDYKVLKNIIATLQKQNIDKFYMITSLEKKQRVN